MTCALLVIAACVIDNRYFTAVDNSDVDDSGRVARDGPGGDHCHCDKHRCDRCRHGDGGHIIATANAKPNRS